MVGFKVNGCMSVGMVEMGVRLMEKKIVNKISICITILTLTGICGVSRNIC